MDIENQPIVLFDGVCNLCNHSVNFIIDRDKDQRFKFASLQSEIGQKLLHQYALDTQYLDSIVLIDGDKMYKKSTAALQVAKHLKGAWSWLYALIIFPRFIRDAVYDFIGRNRYRWFGKEDACRIPTPELRARFLDAY